MYATNVARIEKHNAEALAGQHTWTQGVNKFADLMPAEFSVSDVRTVPRGGDTCCRSSARARGLETDCCR